MGQRRLNDIPFLSFPRSMTSLGPRFNSLEAETVNDREMITLALGNSHCERRFTAMTFGQLTGESNASVNSGLQDKYWPTHTKIKKYWPVLILDPLFFLSYSQITVHTHA